MSAIVPALLTTSRAELEDKLALLDGLVDYVQIDVVDGKYAAPATWPYTESGGGTPAQGGFEFVHMGRLRFEADLMVSNPGEVVGTWIDQGASRVIIHAESALDLAALMETLKKTYGHDKSFAPDLLSIGLAIGVATELSLIEPFMDSVDYVQFMGIATIGKQGQPFDSRVVQKIHAFRRAHPDMPIQVDGGVTLETAPALLSAGVSRLAVGSALWKTGNMKEELAKFKGLVEEYGIYE